MGRKRLPFTLRTYPHTEYWYYGYFDTDGKKRWKTTNETTEAKAMAFAVSLINKDGVIEPKKTALTFTEYFKNMFLNEKCPYLKTVGTKKYPAPIVVKKRYPYMLKILSIIGEIKVDKLRQEDIDKLFNSYVKGKQNIYLNLVNMFKILKEEENKDYSRYLRDYTTTKADRKKKEILSLKDVAKILDYTHYKNPRYHLLSLIIHLTGLRLGEALCLKNEIRVEDNIHYFKVKEHYDYSTNRPTSGTKTGKNEERLIYCPYLIISYMKELGIKKGAYLFENYDGSFISMGEFRLNLKDKATTLFYHEDYSPHFARHFFRSFLMGKKISIEVINKILGHNTGTVSEGYSHLTPFHLADVKNEIEKYLIDFGVNTALTNWKKTEEYREWKEKEDITLKIEKELLELVCRWKMENSKVDILAYSAMIYLKIGMFANKRKKGFIAKVRKGGEIAGSAVAEIEAKEK